MNIRVKRFDDGSCQVEPEDGGWMLTVPPDSEQKDPTLWLKGTTTDEDGTEIVGYINAALVQHKEAAEEAEKLYDEFLAAGGKPVHLTGF